MKKLINKIRKTIGSILLWGGVAIIFFWALLKSLCIIESPVWIEMAPYFGLAAAFGGASVQLKTLSSGFRNFKQEVRGDFKELMEKIHELDRDVYSLKHSK